MSTMNREDTMAAVVGNLSAVTEHPVLKQMEVALDIGLIPYLEGPPGVAKSSLVYQYCTKHDLDIVEIRPVLEDLSGLKGLPNFTTDDDGTVVVGWAVPKHFPRDPNWKGVIFIDEVGQAAVSMMAALTQLTLDRHIGDYYLPDGAKVVLAGNRTKDRASVNRMPTHLANRICRLQVNFHLKAWMSWAKETGLPEVSIAFANFRPNLLDSFDPKLEVNCTPRSYAMGAPLVNVDRSISVPLLQGQIGEGPAAELLGFQEAWLEVPSLKAVREKGDTLPVPTEEHVRYAVISKLATEATVDNFESILVYIRRFSNDHQSVFIQMALSNNTDLSFTKEFDLWMADNEDFVGGKY